jgi:wyosine [tRNA(Phe)-imidazoG37] synthetase (radical SAM superfamily)
MKGGGKIETMKYIYGPVKSRRLGVSLGITLTPYKICSFDCVYCQVGSTIQLTCERKEYIPAAAILDELKHWLAGNKLKLDYITFSGSGEPTLNSGIEALISEIKRITPTPIAVITNASLLNNQLVRQSIRGANLVVPSLDAVVPKVFRAIDRPHNDVNIEKMIEGLVSLRKEFPGKIWLEVMLVKGINDDLRYIKKLKEAVDRINPDMIQLNSPVRITAQANILPVDKNKLKKIKEILGEKCIVL